MTARPGDCMHYTGMLDTSCRAGIDYRRHVGGPANGWACRLPCRPLGPFTKPDMVVPCEIAERISEEEAERLNAEDGAEIAAFLQGFVLAKPIIDNLRAEFRRTRSSTRRQVDCPVCGKKLHISVNAPNGHSSGHCESKGCLSWIE